MILDPFIIKLFSLLAVSCLPFRKSFLGMFATDFGFVYSRKVHAYPRTILPVEDVEWFVFNFSAFLIN